MFRHTCIYIALLASGLCVGCGDTQTASSNPATADLPAVRLALNWYAEAEHGGYVAAQQSDGYLKAGLNVEIRQGGPGAPNLVIQELAAGRIRFAISSADLVVLGRAKGVPLVAILAPLQQSPRCIMVHASSGINRLQDLKNVELAISDSRPFALWMKKTLPLTNVTMVPFSGQVGEFILKKNFAQQAYSFSEPFVAKEAGGDPKVLMLSDIGFNPYASVLVTTEDAIAEQPEIVRSMVTASAAGWLAYLSDPTATNAKIHQDNSEMSLGSLAFGAAALKPLCAPEDGQPACGMTAERWQTLIDQIVELGEIESGSVTAAECFDVSFLPSAN
jgi:NitT/TauT family transport system substrate-binding protein